MKKLLLLSILLISGLVAVAQRWDKNLSSPVIDSRQKQQAPPNKIINNMMNGMNPVPANPADNGITILPGDVQHAYASPNFDPTWAGRFQTVLDSIRLATGMKGTSLAVLVPGQGLLTCVSGISSPGVPVTRAMRFGIMSNTKLFIAVTMMKLQEQGILTLDDHLYQWLPTFRNVDSTTTIRQMLSHQSGIFDYWNDGDSLWNAMLADTSHFFTDQEILAYVKTPNFAPGHGYSYSNTNYVLAGMVIEAATGETWLQKMHEFILNPLTMDSTFAGAFEPRNGPVAAEYFNNTPIVNSPMTGEYSQANACGALLSTAQEMAAWYSALFNGAIISSASLQQVTDFEPTSWYGLALGQTFWYNHHGYNHTGGGIGYASLAWYDPQTKSTLCMLMNDRNANLNTRITPVLNVLYKDCPRKTNDAGISAIVSPWEMSCTATRIPLVKLTNFGSAALTSVQINYMIDGVIPAVYNWAGTLGSGDTVNVILPQVTAGEGYHIFTCYTTLPNGAPEGITYNDTTRSNFIVNISPSVLTELSEGFDGTVFPPACWAVSSSALEQWGQTSLAHFSGTGSVVRANYFGNIGSRFDLDMPKIHVATGTHPELQFDYSYAIYPGYYSDSLQVFISPDCGTTWLPLFNKGGLQLSTSPATYSSFYPQTDAEWFHESISLASYAGDVLIRFRDVCGWSNNLYLDDVKVSFPTGIADKKPNESFTVYPNPTSDAINISGLPAGSEIQISDLSGKLLVSQRTGNDPATINISRLHQGIYILRSAYGVKKVVKL